jgi:hypothetical protein
LSVAVGDAVASHEVGKEWITLVIC